jgi:hypothetical protein
MAENRGGYRKPKNPAPVSGPGKFSERTDGGPADTRQRKVEVTGMGYGENQELNEIQSMAPLAAAPDATTMSQTTFSPQSAVQQPIPLTADTQRPDEPLSAGMPFGPGASGVPSSPVVVDDSDDKNRALVILGLLQDSLNSGNAPQGTVNLIRQLRSEL